MFRAGALRAAWHTQTGDDGDSDGGVPQICRKGLLSTSQFSVNSGFASISNFDLMGQSISFDSMGQFSVDASVSSQWIELMGQFFTY